MSVPIVGESKRDVPFPVLLARVRRALIGGYGVKQSKPFLMLCDLIEIAYSDKQDRIGIPTEKVNVEG